MYALGDDKRIKESEDKLVDMQKFLAEKLKKLKRGQSKILNEVLHEFSCLIFFSPIFTIQIMA